MARDRRDDEDDRPWRDRRWDDRDDEYDDRRRDDEYDDRRRRGDYEYDDRPRRGYDSGRGAPPHNYLAESILVTLFCCWPFGIPAIVNAASVQSAWMAGDERGARRASDQAKMWCWVSFGLGLGVIGLYVGLVVLAGVGAAAR